MTTYLETAEAIYDSVRATHAALVEVYAEPEPIYEADKRDRSRRIAGLHEAIRFGGKAAEVGALLSIARSLETIAAGRVYDPMPRTLIDTTLAALDGELLAPSRTGWFICPCGDWHPHGHECSKA